MIFINLIINSRNLVLRHISKKPLKDKFITVRVSIKISLRLRVTGLGLGGTNRLKVRLRFGYRSQLESQL